MPESIVPWYIDAVIYGVDVEKFADGNGDGIGDFVGLTEKLPYLGELGVTCIWLLPFYGSPDRDNGYDVSDFYAINPKVGTRNDFLQFLHRAGEQGMRVIIDLVANHTSNEHPWFEAARRDHQTRYRDYYVWSNDPPPIEAGATSIFPGEESKLWTYDDVAGAYYFHKFYHFQPELNFANPEVRGEIERVVDYWLAFGISGFRLDAAPLIIGDNGLERANPRDPHGVLRDLGGYLQKRRPGGVLLGEVNLDPTEMSLYFGEGDQLGLLFNFMLSCYIFAAMAKKEAAPIYEALSLLPEPPVLCGWANFLRNLDDLDFSRVPPELKDVVFKAFAPEENMQVFGRGIRRRLAPMLDGDQRRIELAFSIILSLRGPPLFVYGDEIGMGEDLSQEGRNAMRAPMQWSSERNGGFSTAKAETICQPPISRGPFSYKHVNVESQQKDPDSLFSCIKRLITFRRRNVIFSQGRFVRLTADHPAILAYGFEDAGSVLLVVHNLGDHSVDVEVSLDAVHCERLQDMTSGDVFEASTTLNVKMAPYGYRWLASKKEAG
ncbi:maltose alpha-D-glucosyltransferase/alpha-amylase [Rhizobium azibense]|uniref:Maltose alpha-D-glucosyltransferase/alpha-amylase n=1 Tax=Rhizobium azibense TaxID=1136135 RepID=A0A4R3QSZ4_9HYPH|nr:alpha-amylase family protein [Rhizobium azibense]TCU24574.1 maltose alpha-D-glucosyltransferase/alpha-amylase [Rhizobium azibense]TCU39322.1 maltose alpha-D-glucosyltransferase/alpha-amylase [Rhizobium azibense]